MNGSVFRRFCSGAFLSGFLFCGVLGVLVSGSAAAQNRGQGRGDVFDAMDKMEQSFDEVFDELTLEDAYYLGRAVGARLLAAYRPLNNPSLTAYVNRICAALVINSPQPVIYGGYHVMILDTQEINAVASPGGHIFISRGLVEAATSEDTLAAAIAHEVAHIQLQHGLEAVKLLRLTQSLGQAAQAGAAMAGKSGAMEQHKILFGQSVSGMMNTLTINGYAQGQEFDADAFAMTLLARAGYDPAALIDLLKTLARVQPNHPGGFNTTHPAPSLRISHAEQTVRTHRVQDTRSSRTARFQAGVRAP